jgi:putative addiction module component (TIGR02574 family)
MSATELIEQLRPLPTEEKRAFVEQIWKEFGEEIGWVDPDLTTEQITELDRRLAEFEKNPHIGVPWEQIEADLRKRYGWK